jgi:hypothetical protein
MIGIKVRESENEYEGEDEEDVEDDEVFYEIYVETATNTIYEVQFFDDFIMARKASPNFFAEIRRLSIIDFAREFHEYGGDIQAVKDFLRNAKMEFLVESE